MTAAGEARVGSSATDKERGKRNVLLSPRTETGAVTRNPNTEELEAPRGLAPTTSKNCLPAGMAVGGAEGKATSE